MFSLHRCNPLLEVISNFGSFACCICKREQKWTACRRTEIIFALDSAQPQTICYGPFSEVASLKEETSPTCNLVPLMHGCRTALLPEVCRSLIGLLGKQEAVMRKDEICSTSGWLAVRPLAHSRCAMPKHILLNFSINLSRFFWILKQFGLPGDSGSH